MPSLAIAPIGPPGACATPTASLPPSGARPAWWRTLPSALGLGLACLCGGPAGAAPSAEASLQAVAQPAFRLAVAVSPERLWQALLNDRQAQLRGSDARRFLATVQAPGRAEPWLVAVDWDEVAGGATLSVNQTGTEVARWADAVAQAAHRLPHVNQFCRGENPDLSVPEPSIEAATSCDPGNFSSAIHELEKCGDHETTLRLLTACVKSGHAAGLVRIAQMYETGVGLPQRADRMTEFLKRASQTETPGYALAAKVQYATALIFGVGVPKDREQGLTLMREAAAGGDADARLFLKTGSHKAWRKLDGSLFHDPEIRSEAAEPDSDLSYTQYVHSDKRLKCLYGYAADKTGDHTSSVAIFEDCIARWNDVYSMIWLAQLYETGVAMPRDLGKSAELMRRGAESPGRGGYVALARYHWARALASGAGVPRDEAEAARWYAMAADEGVPEARVELAALRARGQQRLAEATVGEPPTAARRVR